MADRCPRCGLDSLPWVILSVDDGLLFERNPECPHAGAGGCGHPAWKEREPGGDPLAEYLEWVPPAMSDPAVDAMGESPNEALREEADLGAGYPSLQYPDAEELRDWFTEARREADGLTFREVRGGVEHGFGDDDAVL